MFYLAFEKFLKKLMQKQISGYKSNCLSPFICEYIIGFSSQQALLSLIENWRKVLDMKGFGGTVLIYLSKAFDTIKHELLIAQLYAYGFE